MKTIYKLILLVFMIILCIACNKSNTKPKPKSQTDRFNDLKKPVILFGKTESNWCSGCWGVELMDGDGKIHSFGNAVQMANSIGSYYKVGDTLK